MTAQCCPIVELRHYTLRPGKREKLIELFDREFMETQEEAGVQLIAQFRDIDRPDVFTWLRGFADMESRAAELNVTIASKPPRREPDPTRCIGPWLLCNPWVSSGSRKSSPVACARLHSPEAQCTSSRSERVSSHESCRLAEELESSLAMCFTSPPDARAMPIDGSLSIVDAVHARFIYLLNRLLPDQFGRTMRHPLWGVIPVDELIEICAWHGRHHTAHIRALRTRNGWEAS